MSSQPTQQPRREEPAEQSASETASRVSLGISLLVLSVLVGLVVYTYVSSGDRPPAIAVETHFDEQWTTNGQYYLPLTIKNVGGATAASLQVVLTLTPTADKEETSQFTIDFLAGGEKAEAVAVFTDDPSQGTLKPTYSFLRPQ